MSADIIIEGGDGVHVEFLGVGIGFILKDSVLGVLIEGAGDGCQ
jgi:hypothetical protein